MNSKKIFDPLAIELLSKLLDLDPKKRIDAQAACGVRPLFHSLVKGVFSLAV